MRYSLILVGLLLVGATVPPASAAPASCTAIAPLSLVCRSEVYFQGDSGTFNATLDRVFLGFQSVTVAFFPKNLPSAYVPGAGNYYADTPVMTCTSATIAGCDGTYVDDAVGPFVPGTYLLVVEITGTPAAAGKWGWTFAS